MRKVMDEEGPDGNASLQLNTEGRNAIMTKKREGIIFSR